jgi:hypothetical protein
VHIHVENTFKALSDWKGGAAAMNQSIHCVYEQEEPAGKTLQVVFCVLDDAIDRG